MQSIDTNLNTASTEPLSKVEPKTSMGNLQLQWTFKNTDQSCSLDLPLSDSIVKIHTKSPLVMSHVDSLLNA